jgi:hypothetical protein
LQLALVNVCDSVESGVPIGFFSFVRKGYHVFELSTDEVFYANATFKTGLNKFYNIFGIGLGAMNIANFTYGVGFEKPILKNHALNFDFSYTSVIDRDAKMEDIGSIVKFKPTYNYSFHPHFAIFAGPTVNFYVSQMKSENYKNLAFHPFWDETYGETRLQIWAGLNAGLRF